MKKYDILYKITPVVLNKPCDNQYHLNKLPIIFPSEIYEVIKLAPNVVFYYLKFSDDDLGSYIVTEYIIPKIKDPDSISTYHHYISDYEENQAIASFPIEIINDYIAEVYDNGGKSYDRYTIIYKEVLKYENQNYFQYFACNENPCYPQGFGQHGESKEINRRALGKKIPFEVLPNAVKRCIINEILETE